MEEYCRIGMFRLQDDERREQYEDLAYRMRVIEERLRTLP